MTATHDRSALHRLEKPASSGCQAARVLLVGLGALGTVAADQLVRAGVGFVRLIDRDFVEMSNLQRQSLFDEEDIRNNLPKAVAAEAKLRRINSSVKIESIVDDVNPSNIEDFIEGIDLVLDALDNFETRFVINDACSKHRKPWIYAAAVGSYGLDDAGPSGHIAMPALSDGRHARAGHLGNVRDCRRDRSYYAHYRVDADCRGFEVPDRKSETRGYPADVLRRVVIEVSAYPYRNRIDGRRARFVRAKSSNISTATPLRTISLCGRNAVQLIPGVKGDIDFSLLSKSIAAFGSVQFNDFLLRCSSPPYESRSSKTVVPS